MAHQSTVSGGKRKGSTKAKPRRPEKPYDGFPLFAHRSGQWAKKIKGRTRYFGPWNDWQAALDLYNEQAADLHAGRDPRPRSDQTTIADLCDSFLKHCDRKVEAGEMVERTRRDYERSTDRIVRVFGKRRPVSNLHPDDFATLRDDIAKTNGVVSLGNEVNRCRVVFNYAHKNLLIEKPVQYGVAFQRPSKKSLRQAKVKNGKKTFAAEECRTLIDNAQTPELKAMILLGLNCGFGNGDCAKLPVEAVDLAGGWIDWPRPKTGVERRCPLWLETVEALRAVLSRRDQERELVFLTKYGNTYENDQAAISKEFRKLLDETKLYRKGRGFYALRHVFRTVADATRDFPAARLIMGHADSSIDAVYREHIEDDRLRAVVDHVHGWLFGEATDED